MPENLQLEETLVSTEKTPEVLLQEAFSHIEGFDEFQKSVLPKIEQPLQGKLLEVMLLHKGNENLEEYLDEFSEGFPINERSALILIEEFDDVRYQELQLKIASLDKGKEIENQIQETENKIQETENKIQETENKIQETENKIQETENKVQETENKVQEEKDKGKETENQIQEISREKTRAFVKLLDGLNGIESIDMTGDFDVKAVLKIIEENAPAYLKAASEKSPGTFIDVYTGLQNLSTSYEALGLSTTSIQATLKEYESEYNNGVILLGKKVSPSDRERTGYALGESNITSIRGDIIRGENGEVIDISGNSVVLSLEGEDGLTLSVGEVELANTRGLEKEKFQIEHKIKLNTAAIEAGEKKIANYENMLENIPVLDTDDERAEYTQSIIKSQPSLSGMLKGAESSDTAQEFIQFMKGFLGENIRAVLLSNENLKADNINLSSKVGKLGLQIDIRTRIAAEKIKDKKEKVRKSQHFIESMGVSRIIANAREIFPRISEQTPVHLPNGDIITGIDFSTMELTGSFTPSLGEGGASDIRTQEVFAQLMNLALTGDSTGPVEITGNGNVVYRLSSEDGIVDKMKFEAYLAEITGKGTFVSSVNEHLFGNTTIEQE